MKETEDEAKGAIQAGYRYALALTHHYFEAEDLVQEAWMRTLSRYGKLPAQTVLYTCLRSILTRFDAWEAESLRKLRNSARQEHRWLVSLAAETSRQS